MSKWYKERGFSSDFVNPDRVNNNPELETKLTALEREAKPLLEQIAQFYKATGERAIVPVNLGFRKLSNGQIEKLKADFAVHPDLTGFDLSFFSKTIKDGSQWRGTFTFPAPRQSSTGETIIMRTEKGIKSSGNLSGGDLAFNSRLAFMNNGRVTLMFKELIDAAMNEELNPHYAEQVREYYAHQDSLGALQEDGQSVKL